MKNKINIILLCMKLLSKLKSVVNYGIVVQKQMDMCHHFKPAAEKESERLSKLNESLMLTLLINYWGMATVVKPLLLL